MPIRFRCSMCSGTLSIARRKAGTEVECPKCGYEVTVPDPDAVPEPGPAVAAEASRPSGRQRRSKAASRPAPDLPLFEHSDFDRLLDAKVKKAAESRREQPEPPARKPDTAPVDDSIQINRRSLWILAAVAVVLMILAFAVGFLVGS